MIGVGPKIMVEPELGTNRGPEAVSEEKLHSKIPETVERISAFHMSLCLLIN